KNRRCARNRSSSSTHAGGHEYRSFRRLRAPHQNRASMRRRSRLMGNATYFSLRLLLIAATIVLWDAVVRVFHMPAYILPAPLNVFTALWRGMQSGVYLQHLMVTLEETLLGFVVGCAFAFVFGAIVALNRRIEYFLYPLIVMFQAM